MPEDSVLGSRVSQFRFRLRIENGLDSGSFRGSLKNLQNPLRVCRFGVQSFFALSSRVLGLGFRRSLSGIQAGNLPGHARGHRARSRTTEEATWERLTRSGWYCDATSPRKLRPRTTTVRHESGDRRCCHKPAYNQRNPPVSSHLLGKPLDEFFRA